MLGLPTLPRPSRITTALVTGASIQVRRVSIPNTPYRKPAPTPAVFVAPSGLRVVQSRTVTVTAFDHPKTYAEFLEREPRYVKNFLISRKCPLDLFEDFEQSLHLHLMTPPGPKSTNYGKADKLATYVPNKMGNIGTRWAWAKYLNVMLSNEYGKLINRNKQGGVRGPNVISTSLASDAEAKDADFVSILEGDDRARLTDFSYQGLTTKVMVSSFLDRVREDGGDEVYTLAKRLMVLDNLTEVADAMGITVLKANRLRRQMIEIAERFKRGC